MTDSKAVCRGSFALGTACGKCDKCLAEKERQAGHPHADLMLIYAQRSKTNAEDWRNWECRFVATDNWLPLRECPHWNTDYTYRLRPVPPKPKTLYAVIHVSNQSNLGVSYYASLDHAYKSLHLFGPDSRIEKYVQVQE